MFPRITFATLAALAALAGPFAAQAAETGSDTDTKSVDIAGTVSRLCTLGDANPASIDLAELVNTSGAAVGRLAAISERQISLPNSFCNYAGTKLTVTGGALLADDTSTPPASFARAVNFTASVSGWASPDATATTAATAGGATPSATADGGVLGEPRLSDLTVTLSDFAAPGDALLVAGDYQGSVTVTLGPDLTPE